MNNKINNPAVTEDNGHIPVLLNEVIEGLNINENGLYVDCTLGGGGHASRVLARLDKGHLYCFDQDEEIRNKATLRLSKISDSFTVFPTNFVNIKEYLNSIGVEKVDGIYYDLGVSSFQFDTPERGFSYNYDSKLDMRMNTSQKLTAYNIVNEYPFEELRRIFYLYGEEKFSTQIARNIEKERKIKPIETTFELVEVIKKSLPAKELRKKGHPAKQVFQALRIAVNNELDVFSKSLADALEMLKPGGRICVITFHSLEDRICKQMFKEKTEVDIPRGLPIKACDIKLDYKLITKKPIIATDEELERNRRSHSAKLRIIEKL